MTQQLSNHGIGASEIASIAGMNPYSSAWDVWLMKTGQKEPFAGNTHTEWGHRLEPVIRQAYADQTGALIHVPSESMFHPECDWARATPDGIGLEYGIPDRRADWTHLLQCKNVGTWVEKAWSAAPPAYVQLQEQWEMHVTGLMRADVAVLIGGSDFRVYTVHRDDRMIADLVTIASDFWSRVQSRTEPKIDESEACRDHFTKKLKRGDAVEMTADAELDEVIVKWERLHRDAKAIDKETERLKNIVRRALADAQASRIASSAGSPFVTFKDGGKKTDWKLIAELLGSTKCDPAEFTALVDANTTMKPETVVLNAPRAWAKEQA